MEDLSFSAYGTLYDFPQLVGKINDLKKVGHLLAHAHIAEKEKRSAPSVMGDDFRPFFQAFKEVGYKGRIRVEGKWQVEELPKVYQVIREQARSA